MFPPLQGSRPFAGRPDGTHLRRQWPVREEGFGLILPRGENQPESTPKALARIVSANLQFEGLGWHRRGSRRDAYPWVEAETDGGTLDRRDVPHSHLPGSGMRLLVFFSLAAYTVSRKRILAYLGAFSIAYTIEQAFILYNEYSTQNLPATEEWGAMEDPLFHILLGAALCQPLWLAILDFADEGRKQWKHGPIAGFFGVSLFFFRDAQHRRFHAQMDTVQPAAVLPIGGQPVLLAAVPGHRLRRGKDEVPAQGAHHGGLHSACASSSS